MYRWIPAAILFVRLAAAQDQTGQATLSHAVELHQSGKYAEAIVAYQSYLKGHPEAAAVRSNLGAALAHEGRYSEAVEQYKQALDALPSNAGIRFNLGLAYYKQGDVEHAQKEFETVYSKLSMDDPQRKRLALLLGECYLRQGEDAKVVALLDPMSETGQSDLAVAYLRVTALVQQGQDERGALVSQRILKN